MEDLHVQMEDLSKAKQAVSAPPLLPLLSSFLTFLLFPAVPVAMRSRLFHPPALFSPRRLSSWNSSRWFSGKRLGGSNNPVSLTRHLQRSDCIFSERERGTAAQRRVKIIELTQLQVRENDGRLFFFSFSRRYLAPALYHTRLDLLALQVTPPTQVSLAHYMLASARIRPANPG